MIPKIPPYKATILDCILGRWGGKYEEEYCLCWYTRQDVEGWHGVDLTDAEWEEISGRFNEMDWQYIQEEVDDITMQVLSKRENPDG